MILDKLSGKLSSNHIHFWLILLGMLGCSRSPSVEVPKFDPGAIASSAVSMFDENADGVLSESELEASPGLKSVAKQMDQNGDGNIAKDEIAARVQKWVDSSIGGLPVACLATYRGQPLADVKIVFEPEPFMANLITTAEGITGLGGDAQIDSQSLPFGAQAGFYRVRIGTPDKIPAIYNDSTTLGAEVSDESPGIVSGRFNFNLK